MAEKRRSTRKIRSYLVLDQRFDVDEHYSVRDAIGQGAYGIVCAATDERSGEHVAVKKIPCAFDHTTYAKRTLREIRLLRLLDHDNILQVKTILKPIRLEDFQDLYIISELMETDLSSIIKSPQSLTEEHVQFFVYQLLRGLKYLHTSDVIHRDLKPRNLLVNSNCDLKICDFGLARIDFPEFTHRAVAMTDYVATRWYRAPEIIFATRKYGKSVDMWSVGCILAELLGRRPIFPGSDSYHQLALMIEVLGKPSDQFMQQIRLENVRKYVRDLADKPPKQFSTLYPQASPLAIDLLSHLLVFEPAKRFTAQEALQHPYFAALHCPEDEPSGPPICRDEFAFERCPCTKASLRAEIIREIRHYHTPPSLVVQNRSVNQEGKAEEDTNSAPVPSAQGAAQSLTPPMGNQPQSPKGAEQLFNPTGPHKQHPAMERISDEMASFTLR